MNVLCTSLCKNLYTYAFVGLIPGSEMVGCYGKYTCNILTNGKSSFTDQLYCFTFATEMYENSNYSMSLPIDGMAS